jgi:hypothetical protein
MQAGGDSHPENLSRVLGIGSYGLPSGAWRWAASASCFIALAAGLAIAAPQASAGSAWSWWRDRRYRVPIFLYAVWPRERLRRLEAKPRGGSGGARQCRLGRHRQRTAQYSIATTPTVNGRRARASPPPPELALAANVIRQTLYRLTRSATRGEAREEIADLGPAAAKSLAAVRPLKDGQTAWWFTPRLGAPLDVARAPAGSGKMCSFLTRRSSGIRSPFPRRARSAWPSPTPTGNDPRSQCRFSRFFGLTGRKGKCTSRPGRERPTKSRRPNDRARGRHASPAPSICAWPANPTAWPNFMRAPNGGEHDESASSSISWTFPNRSARNQIRAVAKDAGRGPAGRRRGA